jgi:PAS domain S-box-containing protein
VSERVRILLIEDNPADVDLVREALPDAGAASFLVESAPRLSAGLARLEAGGIDLVLLDLGLPDSQGLDTLRKTRDAAPNVPVIVLTGNDDQAIGLAAVSAGAQDYLVKGEVTGNSLARSLRHAIARRRAEEALKESEFRYRQLVESLNEGIWMIDEQAVTTFVNPHMAKMLGYTVEEMLGRHLFSFMDAQAVQSATLNLARRRQGISEQHDFEFLRKDGTRVYASVGTAPITDLGGKYRGAIAGVSDLTERKLAEEALQESEGKFRTMAEQTADLIALTDTDGVITYASAASVSLFHCTPEEMCGRHFMEFLDESAIPNATAAFRSAQGRGGRTRDLMLTMKRHDGTLFVGELSGSDFRSGALSATLVVIHDITERKRAEVALTQSHDLLANLARLVPGVVYQYRLYPDGRSAFPYSSPGMYDIYEVTPEEVREDATPVFGRLHPDDYDRVSDTIQESARTLQTFYCEFRVILPQQGLRWRWSQAQPQRMEDGGTLWHGIISDITERKQAEERLKSQLEELQRWEAVMLDREDRVQEIKREVNELCRRVGENIRYPGQEDADAGRHEA